MVFFILLLRLEEKLIYRAAFGLPTFPSSFVAGAVIGPGGRDERRHNSQRYDSAFRPAVHVDLKKNLAPRDNSAPPAPCRARREGRARNPGRIVRTPSP